MLCKKGLKNQGRKSKGLLMLVVLIISILFLGMVTQAEELLVPSYTNGSTIIGLCSPALVKGNDEAIFKYCEAGWCGNVNMGISAKGIMGVGNSSGNGGGVFPCYFPQATYVSRIQLKNLGFSDGADYQMKCYIGYIAEDGTSLTTSKLSIAVNGIQSFTIDKKIISIAIWNEFVCYNSNIGATLEYRIWGTPAGSTVAWNDITGKPALAAASHDHSSISGNAATATNAVNADTVDGSHAADLAASNHNHSGQTLSVNITGHAITADAANNATYATSAGNADTVDSKHAVDFTVAGGTVAWSNVTGKPTTVEGYGITDGQRQMFTVIKGFKFDAYAVGSYTSPMGLATTSILSGAATKITGTLSTAGPTVVDCSSNKKLYFNVIEAPADDTTATVTFM